MTAWMKHFQGNFSWAPDAGEGGLALVGVGWGGGREKKIITEDLQNNCNEILQF